MWCEIVCRSCAHTSNGQFTSSSIPKRSLTKEAREAGYIFKYDEAFCSDKCLEQYESENNIERSK